MAAALAPLIAIVGPTASGKSALALALARERAGEIVSCDSQQVYRGLDIGTAKPSALEREEVRHHLLDVAEPGEPFSAADYCRLGRAALDDIRRRGRLAIVAGGSGLYLRALLQGLFAGPSRDEALRRRLERLAERRGDDWLHALLGRVDPAAAGRIEPADRVRVVRALEVYRLSGRTLSAQRGAGNDPLRGFDVRAFGLAPDRADLRRAVERRTRKMLEHGLLDEVRSLLGRGLSAELRPLQSIGYRQAAAVALGRLTQREAEASIVTDTMRYAKRQMTWFRHQADVSWFGDAGQAMAAMRSWLDEWEGGERPGRPERA